MSYILATNGYVENGQFTEIPIVTTKQTNRFKWMEAWVNKTRSIHDVVDITYIQGGVSESLCGSVAKTTFVYMDNNFVTQRKESRDFIINVADMLISTVPVKPQKGDLIYEDVDGIRYTYEVGAYNNEPPWRFAGVHRTAFRIHSKIIKEETL